MRVKACTKCKEYLIMRPERHKNKRLEDIFKIMHQNHPCFICDFNELSKDYKKFTLKKNEYLY